MDRDECWSLVGGGGDVSAGRRGGFLGRTQGGWIAMRGRVAGALRLGDTAM